MNELEEKSLPSLGHNSTITTRMLFFTIAILLTSNVVFAYKYFSTSQVLKNLQSPDFEVKSNMEVALQEMEEEVIKEVASECDLSDAEVNSKLIIDDKNHTAMDPETKVRTISGVWSDDCTKYVYGIEAHYMNIAAAKDISGIWVYYPDEDRNEMIVSLDPDSNRQKVHRFLTPNLIDAAGYVINIKTKTIVDDGLEVHW